MAKPSLTQAGRPSLIPQLTYANVGQSYFKSKLTLKPHMIIYI